MVISWMLRSRSDPRAALRGRPHPAPQARAGDRARSLRVGSAGRSRSHEEISRAGPSGGRRHSPGGRSTRLRAAGGACRAATSAAPRCPLRELGPGDHRSTEDRSRRGGVVRMRRKINGAGATGHLFYAHHNNGRTVLLDSRTGGLARLETHDVRQLLLAHFRRSWRRRRRPRPPLDPPPPNAAYPCCERGSGPGSNAGRPPDSPGGCPASHPVNRTGSSRYVRVSGVRPAWWAGLSESVGTQCLYEWHGVP